MIWETITPTLDISRMHRSDKRRANSMKLRTATWTSCQMKMAFGLFLQPITQTTLSLWDTQRIIQRIKARYPHTEVFVDICRATQTRQEAVAEQAKGADLTIVVGDPRSNNTNRLVQVSEELAGVPAIRIKDLSQLQTEWLKGKKRVAVTAGRRPGSRARCGRRGARRPRLPHGRPAGREP